MADEENKKAVGRPRRSPDIGPERKDYWQEWIRGIKAQGRRVVSIDLSNELVDRLRKERRVNERIGEALERILSDAEKRKRK
jgi:hypothetical protein